MLKMTIDNEEVVSDKDITINEEMLSASSTILNNVYPKEWEEDKDYTSRFYYPQDYSKAMIQRSYVTQEAEAGTTIQVNGSVTLNDVDTTKNSRVLRLLGQTSQTGTPTPSSPIPVNVVSGDNEILINGKNWFDKDNTLWNRDNASTYNMGGTSGTNTTRIRTTSFRIKGGTTYTISGIPNDIALIAVRTFNIPSGQSIGSATRNGNTFTLNDDVNYIHLLFGGTNFTSDTNTLMANANIMLNEGSSALPYEPYIGNTYNIDLPVENLWGGFSSDVSRSVNSVDFVNKSDGSISVNGTASANSYSLNGTLATTNSHYITLKPGTYTISGGTTSCNLQVYDTSDNIIGVTGDQTFTLNQETNIFIRIEVRKNSIVNNETIYPMLCKGSKANSYTPYGTTPIELCKIGNYQDYIYKDNGSWYLHKEIGKKIHNGSESWTLRTNNGTNYCYANADLSDYLYNNQMTGLSNYFTTVKQASGYSNALAQGIGIYFYYQENFPDTRNHYLVTNTSTTANDLKTWLSTHNTEVYYVLATSTNTEITYQPLIDQLNALTSE